MFPNPLKEVNVWAKIDALHVAAEGLLTKSEQFEVPLNPGRDLAILPKKELPKRVGFAKTEGRAQLLHDLANIELQAMELGVRTLIEFPEASKEFRERLLEITLEEAKHLKLCLEGLDSLKYEFGCWPSHLNLWRAVDREDSLLDRILIVHRYLEGAGLDASDLLLKRLSGVKEKTVKSVVKVIADEELSHVDFGSQWYKKIALLNRIDPAEDFEIRMDKLKQRLPQRLVPLAKDLRLQAGFSADELSYLESLQAYYRANPESLLR